MRQLFEIRVFKNEYDSKPVVVCNPDIESYIKAVSSLDKKLDEKHIREKYARICQTNLSFRYKFNTGTVVCMSVKDDVTPEELEEYNRQGIQEVTHTIGMKIKRKYHRKTPEEKAAEAEAKKTPKQRGRPKGTKNSVPAPKKNKPGKVGRPKLSEEEKARRAEIAASKPKKRRHKAKSKVVSKKKATKKVARKKKASKSKRKASKKIKRKSPILLVGDFYYL